MLKHLVTHSYLTYLFIFFTKFYSNFFSIKFLLIKNLLLSVILSICKQIFNDTSSQKKKKLKIVKKSCSFITCGVKCLLFICSKCS